MSEQYPSVQPNSASPLFKAADHAADMVSRGFNGAGNEQAAIIFRRPDGQHIYSTVAPQTLHDKFAIRALMPKGYQISGIVHSHLGNDSDGQLFSPDDLQTAAKMNVPSYVRFIKDGSIRKFTPGQTQTTLMGDRLGQKKVAYGDPVEAYQDAQADPGALSQAAPPTPDPQVGALSTAN